MSKFRAERNQMSAIRIRNRKITVAGSDKMAGAERLQEKLSLLQLGTVY